MYVQATYFDEKDRKALYLSSLLLELQSIVPGKVLAIYSNLAKVYFDFDKTTTSMCSLCNSDKMKCAFYIPVQFLFKAKKKLSAEECRLDFQCIILMQFLN